LTRNTVRLTPAQSGFLAEHVPGYDPRSWTIASAGRAGSDRQFFRVKCAAARESSVLVVWDSADHDWNRFLSIQRDVSPIVPFLPRIFARDDGRGLILEEDLGNMTVKKFCLRPSMTKKKVEDVYHAALDALVLWQRIGRGKSAVIDSRSMDREMFLWESDYFAQHCVRDYFGSDAMLNDTWEKERLSLALDAAALPAVCIHRDFQSENILLNKGKVRFVDFQGARLGPAGYDVASLVYDPYMTSLTPALSGRLVDYYRSIAPGGITLQSFRICALQRLMQALGAYGKLSIHKGKDWYRAYIPVALQRLHDVIGQGRDFPVLRGIVEECLARVKKQTAD
jgi:aminoglycoside/choline kinase family phosphotransferase